MYATGIELTGAWMVCPFMNHTPFSLFRHARTPLSTCLWVLLLTSSASWAETNQTFASGIERVPLIELYTSEGCSSCPPADRWLSKLRDDPELWTGFTPVGFHVDYWDYLGWRDRFASPEYSNRQRRLADGFSVVYTPGMFRDGREWRAWRVGQDAAVKRAPEIGTLTATVNNQRIDVSFDPVAENSGMLFAHVAVLGMGLETEVRAGENRGKKLRHDFVVLGTSEARLQEHDDGLRVSLELPDTIERAEERAIAVWVSKRGLPFPLQSTGGFLASN